MKLIFSRVKTRLNFIIGASLILASSSSFGLNHLDEYFKYKSQGQDKDATKTLNDWKPSGVEEKTYKNYFIAVNENKIKNYWDLYQDLAKRKKILKLQHESIKKIIEIDLASKTDNTKKLKNFNKIAKKMLKNLRGQPEGVAYELSYLKWILNKQKTSELCTTERSRWLSQISLSIQEVVDGLKTCPITYNDFLYRMRMLIFSGEELKAQGEIKDYIDMSKLEDWEKAYLSAVFFSNVGDPVSAFDKIVGYEKDLKKSEDYYLNLFYISQRAGRQEKADEIINNIIKESSGSKQLNDLKFQKAFLYYQTKRYKEAIAIFDKLIPQHRSYKRKVKTADYDDLTWLRAWCHYLDKDYEQAQKYLIENAQWTRDKAKNLYWQAQTEWALGRQIEAIDAYKKLAQPVLQGRYFNYYNYLAWLRFEENKSVAVNDMMKSQLNAIKSGKSQYLLPDGGSNPVELANNYQNYLTVAETTDEGTVTLINQENSVLESNDTEGIKVESSEALKAELVWADDLTRWGYRDLAKWHLYEVEKNLKTKKDVIPLVQYYLNNQFYNRAILLMQKVTNLSSKKLGLPEDEIVWKSLFPKAFEEKASGEAKKQNISKYLVWSIMKAETQFKTDAISPVGAVGLMQFMPYTTKKVAVILKQDFQPNRMFEPEVAIEYGAGYLKKLSNELGDQINLVAAGYNGGPHRVKLWLKNFKNENNENLSNDEFVEHIPFNETRTYVKRVINYYLAYQKIYEEKFDLKSSRWLIDRNPYKLQEPISLKEEWPKTVN